MRKVLFILLLLLVPRYADATDYFYYNPSGGTPGADLPHSSSGPYFWEFSAPANPQSTETAKFATDPVLGTVAELSAPDSFQGWLWQNFNPSGTFGTAFSEGSPITLSSSSTYYLCGKFNFTRIGGNDIFMDADVGGDGPDSYSKLFEFYGNSRYLIWAGWPNAVHNPAFSLDHKFTFGIYYSPAQCDTDADCGTHSEHEKAQNSAPYSTTNPYLADYETWYAVCLSFKPSSGSGATNGVIELFINGTKVSSYTQKTQDDGLTPTVVRLQGIGTLAQPGYNAPAHKTRIGELLFSDSLAAATAYGFFADPEAGGGAVTVVGYGD